jgi:DNA-binding winged helix-turn-helix (wHTH) protein
MPKSKLMPHAKPALDDVELDLGRYEIRRSGRRVKLARKPMELLILLVSRRDQLVSREDIVAKLWPSDLFVDTEQNVNTLVRRIRAALGDDFAKPRFLETVIGKGYRFVGPLRVIDARHSPSVLSQSVAQAPRTRSPEAGWAERSSLAVLPLSLLGNATDDRGLCLGFADALISRLGNLQGVDVLPISAVLSMPAETTPSDIAAQNCFVVRGAFDHRKTSCVFPWNV